LYQTKRDVKDGEELTFDYGDASGQAGDYSLGDDSVDERDGERVKCLCGAEKCRGYMPFDETL
jgi:SET domain-containing protein